MGPVWDFESSAGNHINYASPEGWHVRNGPWFARLFEDPEFERQFINRWNEVKRVHLDNMLARIDRTARMLERPQQMNFTRWPILGVGIWPNAAGAGSRNTYQSEVDYFKNWLTARIEWIDGEINN
jgi:hypothetical protein